MLLAIGPERRIIMCAWSLKPLMLRLLISRPRPSQESRARQLRCVQSLLVRSSWRRSPHGGEYVRSTPKQTCVVFAMLSEGARSHAVQVSKTIPQSVPAATALMPLGSLTHLCVGLPFHRRKVKSSLMHTCRPLPNRRCWRDYVQGAYRMRGRWEKELGASPEDAWNNTPKVQSTIN